MSRELRSGLMRCVPDAAVRGLQWFASCRETKMHHGLLMQIRGYFLHLQNTVLSYMYIQY